MKVNPQEFMSAVVSTICTDQNTQLYLNDATFHFETIVLYKQDKNKQATYLTFVLGFKNSYSQPHRCKHW